MRHLIIVIAISMILIIIGVAYGQSAQDVINDTENTVSDPPKENPVTSENVPLGSDGDYYAIQLGLFYSEEKAYQAIAPLKEKNFDPYIFQSMNKNNEVIYAVRLGRFQSYKTAEDYLSSIQPNLDTPAIITAYDSAEMIMPPKSASPKASKPTVAEPAKKADSNDLPSDSMFNSDGEKNTFSAVPPSPPSNDSDETEFDRIDMLQKKIDSLENSIKQIHDEAETRQALRKSKEEEQEMLEEQKDILEDVDKGYTLRRGGEIEFNLGVNYGHNTYNAIRQSSRVEDVADHSVSTSLGVSYGLKDNLTTGISIPWVYKYSRVGTVESKEVNDFGNLNLNWQFQPYKISRKLPSFILNGNFIIPVGKSPYETIYGEELSTSSGLYQASLGASLSKVVDPVVVFSNLSVSYPFTLTDINQKRPEGTLDEIDPGMGLGVGFGFGAALSPELNLNMSVGYSYSFETEYKYKNAEDATSGTIAETDLTMGFGYKYYKNYKLNFSIKFPLTESGSYGVSFNTPIRYNTHF